MLREVQPPKFRPFEGVVRLQDVKRGETVVIFQRRAVSPFEAKVIKKEETSQFGNPKVLVRLADRSRIRLGGGTTVLG